MGGARFQSTRVSPPNCPQGVDRLEPRESTAAASSRALAPAIRAAKPLKTWRGCCPWEVVTDQRKLGAVPSVTRMRLTLQALRPERRGAASTASLETSILDFFGARSRGKFAEIEPAL